MRFKQSVFAMMVVALLFVVAPQKADAQQQGNGNVTNTTWVHWQWEDNGSLTIYGTTSSESMDQAAAQEAHNGDGFFEPGAVDNAIYWEQLRVSIFYPWLGMGTVTRGNAVEQGGPPWTYTTHWQISYDVDNPVWPDVDLLDDPFGP